MDYEKVKRILNLKAIHLFLTPLLSDLKNEKAQLYNTVFPSINEKLSKIGLTLSVTEIKQDMLEKLEHYDAINIFIGILGGHYGYDYDLREIIEPIINQTNISKSFYFGKELNYYDKIVHYQASKLTLIEKIRLINKNEIKQAELKQFISSYFPVKYFDCEKTLVNLILSDLTKIIDERLNLTNEELDYLLKLNMENKHIESIKTINKKHRFCNFFKSIFNRKSFF